MTDQPAPPEDDDEADTEAFFSREPTPYEIRCEAMRAAARISIGEVEAVKVVDKARVLEGYLRGPEMED